MVLGAEESQRCGFASQIAQFLAAGASYFSLFETYFLCLLIGMVSASQNCGRIK